MAELLEWRTAYGVAETGIVATGHAWDWKSGVLMEKSLRYRILLLLLLAMVLASPLRVIRVYGKSMEPTLHDGQAYLLDRLYYRVSDVQRDDILVIRHDGEQLVKRLFGLPGDRLQASYAWDGWVTEVNNLTVHPESQRPPAPWRVEFTVPEGHFYVLGDNVEASEDSRKFGFVSRADVVGVLRKFTLDRQFPQPYSEAHARRPLASPQPYGYMP
ncbi:MAG: signal peptidase I [Armatimonadetes bacterium]|nr:signal peptidase I [Armatimonadota bacterium]